MAQAKVGADTITILKPEAHPRILQVQPAPRPASLDGLRPGILTNRKSNARLLLREMMKGLGERVSYANEPVLESKSSNGPPSRRQMEVMTKEADYVICGTSD